jgi:hypothetical protein
VLLYLGRSSGEGICFRAKVSVQVNELEFERSSAAVSGAHHFLQQAIRPPLSDIGSLSWSTHTTGRKIPGIRAMTDIM